MRKYKNLYLSKNSILFDLKERKIYQLEPEYVKDFMELSNHQILEEKSKFFNLINSDCAINILPIEYLKVNMTNYCNLKCKYCYADEGTYCKKSQKIEDHKIDDFMGFLNYTPHLKGITFFGGEPLLNYENINQICELAKEKFPNIEFLLQTNGTVVNQEILDMIKKYNIKCTLSVDGLKEDNDRNRIFKDGKGTFEQIEQNFKNLKEHITSIEATYDGQSKFSEDEIKTQLHSRFEISDIEVGELFQNKNITVDLINFKDEFNRIIADFPLKDKFSIRILSNFFGEKKKRDSYCEAGLSVLNIDSDGTIYPCQLMIQSGNEAYDFGTICNFDLETFRKKREQFLKYQTKDLNDHCNQCSGKWICKHCIAKSQGYEKERCEGFIKNLEGCLDEISEYITSGKLDLLIRKAGEEVRYV